MSFSLNLCVFPLSVLLRVLLTLWACCLSIRVFCYVLLVAIFYSRIVQFLLHPVVSMCSYHLPQLVNRIFFRSFGVFCFACIALPFVDIFLIFYRQYFLVYFLMLFCYFSCVAFFSFSPNMFRRFSFVLSFLSVFVFSFISVSNLPSRFWFFVHSLFKETPIFSQTNFAPTQVSSFNSSIFFFFFWYVCSDLIYFSVSILIVLHSMFLSGGKKVFYSFIILFKSFKFIFLLVLVFALCCSWVWCFYFPKLAAHFGETVLDGQNLVCLILY